MKREITQDVAIIHYIEKNIYLAYILLIKFLYLNINEIVILIQTS